MTTFFTKKRARSVSPAPSIGSAEAGCFVDELVELVEKLSLHNDSEDEQLDSDEEVEDVEAMPAMEPDPDMEAISAEVAEAEEWITDEDCGQTGIDIMRVIMKGLQEEELQMLKLQVRM